MSVEEDGAAFIDEDYVNIVPQDLLERGIRLREEYGIYGIAWRFDDVMEVLKIARDRDMLIVGGDVYRLSGDEPIITYDGWNIKAEDDDAFELAIEYITNYRARNGDDFAYCPVICPGRVSK
ncbi:Imm40 family immunity protein [uncultured Campylobacter sp.]|uniref:Imm40 family immunity protein n=1 Tax=uncultured Campylobacter sp. TaxID=218934 RepID=UPI002634C76C|nr:Imm40 family immunity protein [uncultured Campylobacter sp.]